MTVQGRWWIGALVVLALLGLFAWRELAAMRVDGATRDACLEIAAYRR